MVDSETSATQKSVGKDGGLPTTSDLLESNTKTEQPKVRRASSDKEKKLEKDRKKLVVACIGCRKKKIKCSADRPACTNCLRLNIPCEYPVIRNRGSRFGYMEMLNRRMQHLEKYINCSTNPAYRPQFVTIHQKTSRDMSLLPGSGSIRSSVNSGYTNIRSDVCILTTRRFVLTSTAHTDSRC